ncbi:MAG TPA: hypothetical protein VKZ59_11675, partial [Acidobacteriota bacterium]|nr:hypothetical protein [Acidobacteriota bacterium]
MRLKSDLKRVSGYFLLSVLLVTSFSLAQRSNFQRPSPQEVRDKLKKAVQFYSTRAAIHGGYHFFY